MALFTDGPICSIEDLAGYDSSVLDVASTEGIDLNVKLRLAQEEIGVALSRLLPRIGATLDSVVVSGALRFWAAYQALAMVYTDAYGSQLNDRYKSRRDEFRKLTRSTERATVESGIGVAVAPVPRADVPHAAAAPAPGNLETVYYYATTWMNAHGEEGAPSIVQSTSVQVDTTLTLTVGERPPNGSAWNVYAGYDPDSLWLQNNQPLAPGSTWIQPASLLTTGRQPGNGQAANYVRAVPRLVDRG